MKNLILNYAVIHDALKAIRYRNLYRPRNYGDIGTCRNLAKNLEIAYVFSSILANSARLGWRYRGPLQLVGKTKTIFKI